MDRSRPAGGGRRRPDPDWDAEFEGDDLVGCEACPDDDDSGTDEYVISDEDFAQFKEAVKFWVDQFGLWDWEVDVLCNDEFSDNRATCVTNGLSDRCCRIILTKTWDTKPAQDELSKAAFHEVLELMFMPLRLRLAPVDGVDEYMLDGEVHRIIHILTNTMRTRIV